MLRFEIVRGGASLQRKIGAVARFLAFTLFAPLAATQAGAAFLETNHQFIANGGFESTTNGPGQLAYNTNVTGWTSYRTNGTLSGGDLGYNFVMSAASATSVGTPNEYGEMLKLWSPATGSNNGFRADPMGGGGNFIAADGGYHQGYIAQAITGLIVGQTYNLSFDWAAAQQYGYDGASTESWYYGMASGALGGQTATVNNANHGFVDWRNQSYNFVATSASDYVYFLAQGAPSGQPPFSLLDNVSLTGAYGIVSTAPEPGTWMMMLIGFGLVGYGSRRRVRTAMRTASAA